MVDMLLRSSLLLVPFLACAGCSGAAPPSDGDDGGSPPSQLDASEGSPIEDASNVDAAADVSALDASTTEAMIVGLNAGGWGPNEPSDEAPAVHAVRLDGTASASYYVSSTAASFQVIIDFSGPYDASGVSGLNASSWAANAVSTYEAAGCTPAKCVAIEVLNEPSGTWFWGSNAGSSTNAAAYANLVQATHDAFAAQYGTGGPKILASYDNSAWWSGVVAANAKIGDDFDGIVVHPYGGHGSTSAQGNRALVTEAHDATGKLVWITEVGWPTAMGQPPTGDSLQWTAAQQADNVYDFVIWSRAVGYVGAVIIFGYRDYSTNMWYGVETSSGTRKPSYRALYCAWQGLPEGC
jgi:hypothetical protein